MDAQLAYHFDHYALNGLISKFQIKHRAHLDVNDEAGSARIDHFLVHTVIDPVSYDPHWFSCHHHF